MQNRTGCSTNLFAMESADAKFSVYRGACFCAQMLSSSAALVETALASLCQTGMPIVAEQALLENAAERLRAGVATSQELMPIMEAFAQAMLVDNSVRTGPRRGPEQPGAQRQLPLLAHEC